MWSLSERTCVFAGGTGEIGKGAGHNFREIDPQYGDTIRRSFDYADRWIQSRFDS